ncbi:MAG: M81 family metallopeptidase, partial [Myxococcota bacterium]
MARLFQETNAISPLLTEARDFARFEHHGPALLERCVRRVDEVPGIWLDAELTGFAERLAREPDVEVVPLFSAFAIPGGKIRRAVFDDYLDRLVEAWRAAGPCDGLYLALHGAMGVEGIDDAEGVLLRAVREAIGDVPLVVSFDLHGFLTDTRLDCIDGLVVYRTFPHRDHPETGARAAQRLLDCVGGAPRGTHAWRSLPMIFGGYPGLDFWPPMSGLYRALRDAERRPEVLSANLLTCQPWHDAPSLGWAVHVTTHDAPELAEELLESLAEQAWATRHRMPPPVDGIDAALDKLKRTRIRRWLPGTICLSDISDAVGAGGIGENTAILAGLLDQTPDWKVTVPLRDAPAVERLWSEPVGARVALKVGGNIAPE